MKNGLAVWPLVRIVIPATKRVNVFSGPLRNTTCYAAVVVATAISKIWGLRVEVIDENNYKGNLLGKNGLPDHIALQEENPAVMVGFYCGLSSTMERVWDLASFYKSKGVATFAGSWHAHNLPEETLRHGIDLVVHGHIEPVIGTIIYNFKGGLPLWYDVPGVSYYKDDDGVVWHNDRDAKPVTGIRDRDEALTSLMNVMEDLSNQPFADFGLVKCARIKIYPIGRIRGCGMKCEFCSVRGEACWASPEHFFRQIEWLVETRKAKEFFIVDDRLEENLKGTIEAFEMIAARFGNRLRFTVQMRLEAATNTRLLEVLHRAGVTMVCIGYESPIAEELKAMKKGLSAAKMLEYTKIWRKRFRVHGMFIIGYPLRDNLPSPSANMIFEEYKQFLKKAHLDSIQALIASPVPGSELERRLRKENRLLLPDEEMWPMADGNFVLFKPKGLTARELQNTSIKIMSWFYGPFGWLKLAYRFASFPADWFIRSMRDWKEDLFRDWTKFGARHLLNKWKTTQEHLKLLEKIERNSKNK